MNLPPSKREREPTKKERQALDAMLSGFLLLGPINALSWLAEYFEASAKAQIQDGHHVQFAGVLLELVGEVRELAERYRARFP